MTEHIQEFNRRAVQASTALVAAVTVTDLARPTPCLGWTVADLVAHMTAQHQGFAAAALGDGATLSHWAVHPDASDLVGAHREAADAVLHAFAADGVLDRRFVLPEIFAEATFSGEEAIGFHFIDYLVHAWDMARSLNRAWAPGVDLAHAALGLTRTIPNGAERLAPGAAFAPGRAAGADVDPFAQVLLLLGRDPALASAR